MQPGSPNYIHLGFVGMRFQMKKVLKHIEVGFNPHKGLAQVDKDGNVEDRVRGQVMHLNPPIMNQATEKNQKQENRGPEEHEEEKRQIRFLPHEEKICPQIRANGSLSGAEEDGSRPNSKDGARRTYSISIHGPPPRQQQRRPPSPLQQISLAPLERFSLASRSGASDG